MSIKNSFKYKLIGIILYFFLCLVGFSVIISFSPKVLLFNEKIKNETIKLNLFKDFSKNIYENINTQLIKNLTLTEDGKECPENFEVLKIKNQYYGNFDKFYGNKSFCIERLNDNFYAFPNILNNRIFNNLKNKKKCGELMKYSGQYLYVSDDMNCPLNLIEINTKSRAKNFGNDFYKMSPDDQYLIPIYGKNTEYPVITNIEIINNYKVCIEKETMKDLPCEFPDNNECFIEDNYEQIFNMDNDENYRLYPGNIARWNLEKDNNIAHNFCKDDIKFHIFVSGYINFTDNNLQEFELEFPYKDFNNNPLHKTYEAYKSPYYIDNYFYLISYNLLIWSLFHFIVQIMLYFQKKGIREIYLKSGFILFLVKLIVLLAKIVNFYYFYLKIEKVYLVMVDQPRNKIIEYYSKSRSNFIIKIVLICLAGFIIISMDLIIFIFTLNIQWGEESKLDNKIIEEKPENPEIKENIFTNTNNDNEKNGEQKLINTNPYLNDIQLVFFFKDNSSKSFIISASKNSTFNEIEQKLKDKYSDLKDINMKLFMHESNIIDKTKSVLDNGLKNNDRIIIS